MLPGHSSASAPSTSGSAPPRRRGRAVTAAAAALVLVAGPVISLATAPPTDASAADRPVGHRVEQVVVPGTAAAEQRPVDVHLWYPADPRGFTSLPRTVYTSWLYGRTLVPELWDPLSWQVPADLAREGAAVVTSGPPLPVIVFSHGSVNEPIDYAHTLERIAAEGFVVAAPTHVNNTQDDVRIDFVNTQALAATGDILFPCRDGRPRPCSRTDVGLSIADRVRDISFVLDALPQWLGTRVDTSQAGVLGHSRGTVTALAAAGGSTSPAWPVEPEPRVRGLMGMAIGSRTITGNVDLASVRVPTVLVAGQRDANSTPDISRDAFHAISSSDKALIAVPDATHRSFDSTYCEQLQAAGAAALDPDLLWDPRAILDRHTFTGIARSPASGWAEEYCPLESFTTPVDIRPLVTSVTGFDFAAGEVPTTGLDTEEVEEGIAAIAVAFFGTALDTKDRDGLHLTRHLAPTWLQQHVPMVGCVEVVAGEGSVSPPGQQGAGHCLE